jgi:regulator of PEP synthase PpsR (kinase-PPPase family)
MVNTGYFHLHLVSDATGETLITVARAGGTPLPYGALAQAA